jgi:mono/diheme cytochrome c family protein
MASPSRSRVVATCSVLILAAPLAGARLWQHQGAHSHPEAAKLKNPVAADDASLAAGKKFYDELCAGCHGDTGKGDGPMAGYSNPLPASFADAEWKHGPTDGEIFTVIREGVKDTAMLDFKKDLTERQTWDVVNYVRSLGPKPAKDR